MLRPFMLKPVPGEVYRLGNLQTAGVLCAVFSRCWMVLAAKL
jgi:hypothetical protein